VVTKTRGENRNQAAWLGGEKEELQKMGDVSNTGTTQSLKEEKKRELLIIFLE